MAQKSGSRSKDEFPTSRVARIQGNGHTTSAAAGLRGFPPERAGAAGDSRSVFHAPQTPPCPFHLRFSAPHSEQKYNGFFTPPALSSIQARQSCIAGVPRTCGRDPFGATSNDQLGAPSTMAQELLLDHLKGMRDVQEAQIEQADLVSKSAFCLREYTFPLGSSMSRLSLKSCIKSASPVYRMRAPEYLAKART